MDENKNELEKEVKRWSLILGEEAGKSFSDDINYSKEEKLMMASLDYIYGSEDGGARGSAGLGKGHSFKVSKWLGDIRELFPKGLVTVMQKDAIERKNLKSLLFEPEVLETVTPDVALISTFMSLKNMVPEKSKEQVRVLIKKVVEEIKKTLESEIKKAVFGALRRGEHSPIGTASSIDFKYTIRRNIKNYVKDINTIVPQKIYYFERNQRSSSYNIIVDMDQSGSMGESIIYGSIMGCILSSIPAVKTHVVAFDTEVVDLTDKYGQDPVDMIYGVQLGGGTDINKSIGYCMQKITEPRKTIFFLITDLYEGGSERGMFEKIQYMQESGVKVIVLLAITDKGHPYYDKRNVTRLKEMGIECTVASPYDLGEIIHRAIN